MKKRLWISILFACIGLVLVGCGKDSSKESDTQVLKVGASPAPHAQILEHIQPLMKEKGVDLEVVTFDDYVLPNKALEEKEIDANYFQHIPYFELAKKENDYDFANASSIHVEPMGLYSQKIKNIKDLSDGATVITSNSESDWGRILTMLQDAGVIKLKDGVDATTATFDDIAENPKNIKFKHDINPEILATTYNNNEADLVAINANFAVSAGLDPEKDSVLLESDNSPYANIIAVRSEDKDDPRIQTLIEVLHDPKVQEWITEEFQGVVKPVNAEAK